MSLARRVSVLLVSLLAACVSVGVLCSIAWAEDAEKITGAGEAIDAVEVAEFAEGASANEPEDNIEAAEFTETAEDAEDATETAEATEDAELLESDSNATLDADLTNWMSNIPGNVPISEINIPATHDSASRILLGEALIKKYGQCQDWTFEEQLKYGIRAFDLRLIWASHYSTVPTWKDMILVHGIFTCVDSSLDPLDFTDVLKTCLDFLKDHPDETIVMLIATDGKQDDKEKAKRYFRDMREDMHPSKGGDIRYYEAGDEIPTLDEVRGCIVLIDDQEYPGTTPYENDYTAYSDIKATLVAQSLRNSGAQDFWQVRGSGTFCKESYCNAPYARDEPVVKNVFTTANRFGEDNVQADTPRTVADKVRPTLSNYKYAKGMRYGWIYMDFPTTEVVQKIIATNYTVQDTITVDVALEWRDDIAHDGDPGISVSLERSLDGGGKTGTWSATGVSATWEDGTYRFADESLYYAENGMIDYRVVVDESTLPDGYTYSLKQTDVGTYTLILRPPTRTVNVTLLWKTLPDHVFPQNLNFTLNFQTDSEKFSVTTTNGKTVNYNSETESRVSVYFDEKWGSDYTYSLVLDPASLGSDYRFDAATDVKQVDEWNWEITVHPAAETRELTGSLTFVGDEEYWYWNLRPAEGDGFFEGIEAVATYVDEDGDEITVMRLPVTVDLSKLDSDDLAALDAGEVPVYDLKSGKKLTWTFELPDIDGYEISTTDTDTVLSAAKYLTTKLTWVGDTGHTSARHSVLVQLVKLGGAQPEVVETISSNVRTTQTIGFEPHESHSFYTVQLADIPSGYTASAVREEDGALAIDLVYNGGGSDPKDDPQDDDDDADVPGRSANTGDGTLRVCGGLLAAAFVAALVARTARKRARS